MLARTPEAPPSDKHIVAQEAATMPGAKGRSGGAGRRQGPPVRKPAESIGKLLATLEQRVATVRRDVFAGRSTLSEDEAKALFARIDAISQMLEEVVAVIEDPDDE